jgi:hypothetical protein
LLVQGGGRDPVARQRVRADRAHPVIHENRQAVGLRRVALPSGSAGSSAPADVRGHVRLQVGRQGSLLQLGPVRPKEAAEDRPGLCPAVQLDAVQRCSQLADRFQARGPRERRADEGCPEGDVPLEGRAGPPVSSHIGVRCQQVSTRA